MQIIRIRKKGFHLTIATGLKWPLTIALMLCSVLGYSRLPFPADTTAGSYVAALSKSYPSRNEMFLSRLKAETTDKKLRRHYESNFKAIFKMLNEEIREGQMIYVPPVSAALDKMLLEIKTNNHGVPEDLQIFLLRDGAANAHTIGDNSLFINLGLFYYLESEDQVASVLAHEIAHLMLRHTLKALHHNYQRNKESEADVKAIEDIEVRKADQALDLLKKSIYKGGKMTRAFELQADSLGYVLFGNTRYRKAAFTESLAVIGRCDTLRSDGLVIEAYKRFFDLPTQPFREDWLRMEDYSSYNYGAFTEKFDRDSLSSHPKSNERIDYLKGIFPELAKAETASESTTSAAFKECRALAKAERLPNLFFNEQYGGVIYLALRHLQENPNDPFYKDWLGKGFQKIYEARRDYQLNRYLDRIAPKDQSASYMQFLSFMWNLKLEEIKQIADYYSKKDQ
jgi:Zn-dependent protease with chaperone function